MVESGAKEEGCQIVRSLIKKGNKKEVTMGEESCGCDNNSQKIEGR